VRKRLTEIRTCACVKAFSSSRRFWLGLGVFGALPLMIGIAHDLHGRGVRIDLRLHDDGRHGADRSRLAAEGARSTTAASCILRRSWGIIVLAVAVLPILGVGGMQLYGQRHRGR
jgi:hypothetical protein